MSEPIAEDLSLRVAFRVDASLTIGSGHVMRCLTLAHAMRACGAECHFLCRLHRGHLIEVIEGQGFPVHRLAPAGTSRASHATAASPGGHPAPETLPEHADWLGTDAATDARQSLAILKSIEPDWLVVDHYALDAHWEALIREALPASRLLVIDDLADRPHVADVLLDQNLGRQAANYAGLVPHHCHLLIGPAYALLRDEFARWRDRSLTRRQEQPRLERLLITLGGVDKDNVTGRVLDALKSCALPDELQITVVMGATAPCLEDVKRIAKQMPRPTEVVVNVDDMAKRMAAADLAIGAAGSTSWERCCLGLPALMLVLADNQGDIAEALHRDGAAWSLGRPDGLAALDEHWSSLVRPERLASQAARGATLVDGQGVTRLIRALMNERQPEISPHD